VYPVRVPATRCSRLGAVGSTRVVSQLERREDEPASMTVKAERAGSTGIGSASSILADGRCRIPSPDLRTDPAPKLRWPSRRDASSRPRYRARARKLTLEQEAGIRALAATKSLRALAAEFSVSHETIRAICRRS
jgi:hypothetical protein